MLAPSAAILILIGLAGLAMLARRSGRPNKLAAAGLVSGAGGLFLLMLGGLIQATLFNGDFPWMPLFVLPGVLGMILGFVLIGVFILGSGELPRWLGVLLIVTTVLLLGANEQASTVLLAIPFGLSMVIVGFFMSTDRIGSREV